MSNFKMSITMDANPEGINQYSGAATAHVNAAKVAANQKGRKVKNSHMASAHEHSQQAGMHVSAVARYQAAGN